MLTNVVKGFQIAIFFDKQLLLDCAISATTTSPGFFDFRSRANKLPFLEKNIFFSISKYSFLKYHFEGIVSWCSIGKTIFQNHSSKERSGKACWAPAPLIEISELS